MDEPIQLIRAYRVTAGAADRLRLLEEIFRQIEPDLRFFIFGSIEPPAAQDVLQEVLKAISGGVSRFAGNSKEQFWAWCHRIARNKLNDYFRKQANERLQPLPQEELWQLADSSAEAAFLTTGTRHDLEYALNLPAGSKPECQEYLRKHFMFGLDLREIADEQKLNYDAARMKIRRCLEEVRALVS